MRFTWRQLYPDYDERLRMMALHVQLSNSWAQLSLV